MRKGVAVLVLIVVVIVVSVVARLVMMGDEEKGVEKYTIPVEVASAKIVPYSEHYTGFGTVFAEDKVPVLPKAPGKLIRFTVGEGQYVSEGQVIALIDRDVPGLEFQPLKVESPASGLIVNMLVDPGGAVAPSQPMAMVVSSSRVNMLLPVSEKDISRLRVGQSANIYFDAFPGETFTGRVKKISPIASPLSHTFEVEVAIENRGGRVKDGMFGRAVITISEPREALFVPIDALIEEDGGYSVFIIEDGTAKLHPVSIGIKEHEMVEIIDGVGSGDIVVLRGQSVLKDGDEVDVVSKREWGD
ncbi:MAG TPA: efflux RND transporter periplasmic adaptor subunit [Firmicutes bacterium]|uniref:RND efflux pump membrane fusion protein barrel-sandwich domain-containing protein n=1 Tax=Candidatus Coatesbacteria bacterium 4484_99 TaxID=1970774 RepID=A0A1W9S170_9BACT|nr:MAG: hypothetical protein B6D57_02570 [Candidatus Coatesbacteria bacterium 4484_99]RLC42476.1 MAG: hypothetical protein DRH51_00690 [Candidatus Coatesbacteria bacterium]RLC43636.1 MAG: hypothetical protein DRH49_00655 [Candidatus Coatesbacteria bacterium]RLC43856.1 MAG: hypothetical protein DRH44_04130 [Candidatus Coatesbacteria bacterium]HDM42950.1 efflux RND transporter periplasmic adaptor subunit [Bacillota bacterium]